MRHFFRETSGFSSAWKMRREVYRGWTLLYGAVATLALCFVAACSNQESSISRSAGLASSGFANISVNLSLNDPFLSTETTPRSQKTLSLASSYDLVAYSGSVKCDGLSEIAIDQSKTSLAIPMGATQCKMMVRSVKLDGASFSPNPSKGFKTYLMGDQAEFVSSESSQTLYLAILSQLPSPLLSSAEVRYQVSRNDTLGDILVNQQVSGFLRISGKKPPFFSLSANFDASKNLLTLMAQCKVDQLGNSLDVATCNEDRLKDLKVGLVDYPSNLNQASLQSAVVGVKSLSERGAYLVAKGMEGMPRGASVLISGLCRRCQN